MHTPTAAVQVLTRRSLFDSIVAFATGIPLFALHIKHKLKCAQPEPHPEPVVSTTRTKTAIDCAPEDIELWPNAVHNGDKRTLEALHLLAMIESPFGDRVAEMLTGITGFAVSHARDSEDMVLLEWMDSKALFKFDWVGSAVLYKLGEDGDLQMLR